jgi:hypothetical protein
MWEDRHGPTWLTFPDPPMRGYPDSSLKKPPLGRGRRAGCHLGMPRPAGTASAADRPMRRCDKATAAEGAFAGVSRDPEISEDRKFFNVTFL